jgi:hypothetical protein
MMPAITFGNMQKCKNARTATLLLHTPFIFRANHASTDAALDANRTI